MFLTLYKEISKQSPGFGGPDHGDASPGAIIPPLPLEQAGK